MCEDPENYVPLYLTSHNHRGFTGFRGLPMLKNFSMASVLDAVLGGVSFEKVDHFNSISSILSYELG